jgi:hypothetical protein
MCHVISRQSKPHGLAVSVSHYKVNKAAELQNCIKQAQQTVIRLTWVEGVSSLQIHQHTCAQYGDTALSKSGIHLKMAAQV